jgi:hypothetical protein
MPPPNDTLPGMVSLVKARPRFTNADVARDVASARPTLISV